MMRRSLHRIATFIPLLMPALSPSMEKGTVAEWVAKVGDKVQPGDVVMQVQTDKAVVAFEYGEDDGFLAKIFREAGSTVPVGDVVAVLVEDEADIAKADEYKPPEPEAAEEEPAAAPAPTRAAAAPVSAAPAQSKAAVAARLERSGPAVSLLARRLSEAEMAVVVPTGKGDRYTKYDLVGLYPKLEGGAPVAAAAAPVATPAAAPKAAAPIPAGSAGTPTVKPQRVDNFRVVDDKLLAQLI